MKSKRIKKINEKLFLYEFAKTRDYYYCSKCSKKIEKNMICLKYKSKGGSRTCIDCSENKMNDKITTNLRQFKELKNSNKSLKKNIRTINKYKDEIKKHNLVEAI